MLLLIFSFNAMAQQIPVYRTQPVLVNPTNFREIEPDAVVELPPNSTSKAATLDDVLRGAPGLVVARSGGTGQPSTLFIRGAAGGHTLVLLDGVEINDPSQPAGGFDFSTVDLNLVEKIEIFKGPQALRYGSGAIGGVVNIVTKRGGDRQNIFSARAGSHQTNQLTAIRLGETYSLSVTRFETAGISAAARRPELDGHRYVGAAFRGGAQLSEDTGWEAISRVVSSSSDLDFSSSNSGPNFIEADDPNYHVKNWSMSHALKGQTKWNSQWKSNFALSRFHLRRRYHNPPDVINPAEFYDDRHSDSTKIESVTAYAVDSTTTVSFGLSARLEQTKNSAWIAGAFADVNLSRKPFFIHTGGRYDYHKKFGQHFTYALGPGVRLFTDTTLTMRLASAFKAPSLFQIYDSTFGNANLQPEKVWGEEASLEQGFGENSRAKITAFRYHYRDLIQFTSRYQNVSSARTSGVEVEYSHKFSAADIQGVYTFTDARDDQTGARLLRRPRNSWRVSAGLAASESLKFRAEFRELGSRPDVDAISSAGVMVPGYDVLDISAALTVAAKTQISASVENTFDRDYEEVAGYGTPGLGFYCGIKTEL